MSIDVECKTFELVEAGRKAMRGLPIIARLDGRAFHTFTRGLERPYDKRMSTAMVETTRYLVFELRPLVGYTQSDEITLVWFESSESLSQYSFDGRFQKLVSITAGMASAKFSQLVLEHLPEKANFTPHFDSRVWQVPTIRDALRVLIWREDDATKNSITMAAQAYYSDRELHEQNSSQKQELLFKKGVNWNDYPTFFKRGTYLQRKTISRKLTTEELERIPEAHRPEPDIDVQRTIVSELDIPPIRQLPISEALQTLFPHWVPIVSET